MNPNFKTLQYGLSNEVGFQYVPNKIFLNNLFLFIGEFHPETHLC